MNYSSTVLHDLIAANSSGGQQITELIGADANAAKIKETLASFNPIVFAGCGHGSNTTFTVQNLEVFMQVGDANVPLMKDRVVHLNSCETGRQLGPALISAGATAYVGSNESFWFYTGDAANTTRAVRSPFLAEWSFCVALLQGKSVSDARAAQLASYETELTYWIEGDGKNHKDGSEIARIININKSISTFLGEGATVPSPSGTAPAAGALALPPEVTVPASFAAIGVAVWMVLRK